ncbi:uncharacterized protein TM35_000021060 [Trypanosoma theileri]|uniref:Uncharacterized protein n=1 Tax=Trypanosoma theileri TaxID=67003 RepID=A0A1X0P8L4_9TRYP|nr:uncharacterized protein TM35_000021060 [Trypanosoma theileri]ORC92780.1 hypothetical protein TM35_000021060 [Trypanosoma theileri]
MYRESDVFVSQESLEAQRRIAQRRVFIITLVVFSVVAGGSFACVFFGISEIVNKDRTLMNDGLGEVMTVLGIFFTIPCIFCIVALAMLALNFSCCRTIPSFSKFIVLALIIISFVAQQVLTDVYIFSIIGLYALSVVVLDVCVLLCHAYYRFHRFYLPTILTILLVAGKISVICFYANLIRLDSHLGPIGIRAVLFLTIPIVQLPLYITIPRDVNMMENPSSYQETIVENFNNNFNLFLLHLLNSLDVISMYGSFVVQEPEGKKFIPTPEPFRILIIIIVCIAYVGNNVAVIHLFFKRDGVEHAELRCLPRNLRDATNQWSSTDISGSHKRRILQYILFLLVVCDIPLLAVRIQLWWKGYQMLSVFVTKNIKSILDVIMVLLRVGHSGGYDERSRYLLPENS